MRAEGRGAGYANDPGCVFNEKHWDDLMRRGVATDPESPTKTADGRQREIDDLYATVVTQQEEMAETTL